MIGRLNHVAMVVPDLVEAAALYRDRFGAEVSDPVDLPDHGVTTVFVSLPIRRSSCCTRSGKVLLYRDFSTGTPMAACIMCATR